MKKVNYWLATRELDGDESFPFWEGKIAKDRTQEEFANTLRQIYDFAREEELYRLIHKIDSGSQI
jgi:hypothetical protein